MLNEERKPRGFRIYAKKFFLTYSQVPEEMTPELVIDRLREKIEFTDYVVGEERHEDGGKHFHVVLITQTRRDVRSHALFNIEFESQTYRCNCQKVNSLPSSVRYVCKENKYITNIGNLYEGALLPPHQLLREMAAKEGPGEGAAVLRRGVPEPSGGESLVNMERPKRSTVCSRVRSSSPSLWFTISIFQLFSCATTPR
jgi:hypothetical protein